MLLEEDTNPTFSSNDDANTGNTDDDVEIEICIDVDLTYHLQFNSKFEMHILVKF